MEAIHLVQKSVILSAQNAKIIMIIVLNAQLGPIDQLHNLVVVLMGSMIITEFHKIVLLVPLTV